MSDAVFTARYVKGTPRTDGDAYFIFSVPVEFHKGPLDMLGGMMPTGDNPVYVAIAILKDPPQTVLPPKKVEKPAGKTPSQRAWALCQSGRFRAWLANGSPDATEETTTFRLRERLGIKSRSELDTNPEARARFENLEREYQEASR